MDGLGPPTRDLTLTDIVIYVLCLGERRFVWPQWAVYFRMGNKE